MISNTHITDLLIPLRRRQLHLQVPTDAAWAAVLQAWLADWGLEACRYPHGSVVDGEDLDPESIWLLEIDSLGDQAIAAIASLCADHPDAGVVTLSRSDDPRLQLVALQTGAVDHIHPESRDQLCRALIRLLATDQRCGEPVTTDDGSCSTLLRTLEPLPTLADMDWLLLEEALRRHDGIVARAARDLGVTPQAIHNRRRRAETMPFLRNGSDAAPENP